MLTTIMIGNVNMLMFDFIANLIKICGNIRSLCLVYFLKKKKFTTSKWGTTGRWLLRLHHIPGSSSHEDCNCNFWKSQKPIEPGVCVGSEFSSSSSSLWYLWAYPTVPWGRGIITVTRESPFSSLKKKKKKNLAFVPFAQTFQQNVHVLKLFREMPLFMELEFYVKFSSFCL